MDSENHIPTYYNPFEHIIETTTYAAIDRSDVLEIYSNLNNIEDKQERYKDYVNTIADAYLTKGYYKDSETPQTEIGPNTRKEIKDKKHITGFFYQLYILCLKQLLITMRHKKVLFIKLFQSFFIAVLLALLFNNLRVDEVGIRDRLGLSLIVSIIITFNATTANLLIRK